VNARKSPDRKIVKAAAIIVKGLIAKGDERCLQTCFRQSSEKGLSISNSNERTNRHGTACRNARPPQEEQRLIFSKTRSASIFDSAASQWQTDCMAEPTSKFERAAWATEAAEQRIARAREILASFTASDINCHGFYTEPFARQSGLGRAAREIKAAVHIITDTCWPDENETAVAACVDPRIAKLREQCRGELRAMMLHFRNHEEMADACTDPDLLTKLLRALSSLRQIYSAHRPGKTLRMRRCPS